MQYLLFDIEDYGASPRKEAPDAAAEEPAAEEAEAPSPDLVKRLSALKGLGKDELKGVLAGLEKKFNEQTGLDLAFIVRSYKTALAGTYDEKTELWEQVKSEDREKEYWLGYGLSFGDRISVAGLLEYLGRSVPAAKYAARVFVAYIATDALLGVLNTSVIGLVRENVEKMRKKAAHAKQNSNTNYDSVITEDEELGSWIDEPAQPAPTDGTKVPDDDDLF